MTPDVSVVVITRDRADKLRGFLASAAGISSDRPWELVVIDNGSSDETPDVIAAASDTFPAPVVSVVDETPGVARARNRGWQAASAPVVMFTNDDCYLPSDYVDRIAVAFDADERLAFLGGSVIRHDPGDDKLGNVSRPEPLDIPPGMFLTPGALITANLAFRRDVLESVGGFDEVFAYGNGLVGDDSDAVARISILGWRGRFDPELVVRHHHGHRAQADIRRVQHGYDMGRGAFYAKSLLDPKLRWLYLKGWARLTTESLRRDGPGPTARELQGAARYLAIRARQRVMGSKPDGATRPASP